MAESSNGVAEFIDGSLDRVPSWLKATDEYSDVILSTRARLARNLTRFPLLTIASQQNFSAIEAFLSEKLRKANFKIKLIYIRLDQIERQDVELLFERRIITRDHLQANTPRGVAVSAGEDIAVMVNEEDHVRMHSIEAGFAPEKAVERVYEIEEAMGEDMSFAFHSRYGYMTCCPTNLGSGLRVSILVHLPGIVLAEQIEKALQAFYKMRYTIRGFYGEHSAPTGFFFQVANQSSLGRTEEEILKEIKETIPQLVKLERECRERIFTRQKDYLEDRIFKAYGNLSFSRIMSTEEAIENLSIVRLGVSMGIMKGNVNSVGQLLINVQPAHIQKRSGKALDVKSRDVFRAKYIQSVLKNVVNLS